VKFLAVGVVETRQTLALLVHVQCCTVLFQTRDDRPSTLDVISVQRG